MFKSKIISTGKSLPENVVTNQDLARLMNTDDEWIAQRTGIKERRHVKEGETPQTLAFNASSMALSNANLDASDLDAIFLATLSPQVYFPGTGMYLGAALNLKSTPIFDLRNQCSGFLYALSCANAHIKAGIYKRVLVVGVEVHSRGLNFTNQGRDVAVLFGDGAGAVILEASDEESNAGIHSIHLHSDGSNAEVLYSPLPSMAKHPQAITKEQIENGEHYPIMNGQVVFRHAVKRLPEALNEALKHNQWIIDDVDAFLFHQANLRINEYVAQKLSIPINKAPFNIDKYGNCSAASIPILLHECVESSLIKKGSKIVLCAFGSGFTWGSAAITY